MKKIFWLAGEKSGDLHAACVLKKLTETDPELHHYGIGGPGMQQYGLEPLFPFERFSVMGFIEVLKHIFFFLQVEKKIKTIFHTDPPDLVVLIDYPGLNMRIAKLAKKFNIPVLYYICPQFWAWKKRRLQDLKKYTDHVAYILPFEGDYLEAGDVRSTYVGHPIAEEITIDSSKREFASVHRLDLKKKWLGFLPGSRDNEIKKMLPVYLDAIKRFDQHKFQFLISRSDSISYSIFMEFMEEIPNKNIKIIEHDNYALMKHCDFIVSTSGTATLETAYIGTPFLIAYKTSPFTYELAKRFIKIKRIGLPNIILDRNLAPELIQHDANADNIHYQINKILNDPELYKKFNDDLEKLHQILGKKSASENTSALIRKLLKPGNNKPPRKKRKKRIKKLLSKIFDPVIFFLEKYLAALIILILGSTCRFRIKTPYPKGNIIHAFWHRNLLPLAYLHRSQKVVVLISSSKDGQFIAGPVETLGFQTARGSTSRRGSQALREMIKLSRRYSLAITPDGPKGPAKKIKDGLVYTAYLTKLPIVLIAVDIEREKVFNSWDKFRFPYPFSRINISYSEPIYVESKDNIDGIIADLERDFENLEENNKI